MFVGAPAHTRPLAVERVVYTAGAMGSAAWRRLGAVLFAASVASSASAVGCDPILGVVPGELPDARTLDATTDRGAHDAAPEALGETQPDVGCVPPPDGAPVQCAPDAAAVDPTVDPANCGFCGHDCVEAGCQGGLCQPATMIVDDGGSSVYVIGSVGDELYWFQVENDTLRLRARRRDWTGPTRTVTVVSDAGFGLSGATVDDSGVYYFHRLPTYFYELARAGLEGGQTALTTALGTESTIVDLAVDEAHVYVADRTNRVSIVAKDGGSSTSLDASLPQSVVTDPASSLHWISWVNASWTGGDDAGTLVSYEGKFSNAHVTSSQVRPSGLALAEGWLYFFDNAKSRLARVPEGVAGATAETHANWSFTPEGGVGPPTLPGVVIAVTSSEAFVGVSDPTNAYDIAELSLCGGPTRFRASASEANGPIVADDTFLYWGTTDQIHRMAR